MTGRAWPRAAWPGAAVVTTNTATSSASFENSRKRLIVHLPSHSAAAAAATWLEATGSGERRQLSLHDPLGAQPAERALERGHGALHVGLGVDAADEAAA